MERECRELWTPENHFCENLPIERSWIEWFLAIRAMVRMMYYQLFNGFLNSQPNFITVGF